MAGARRIQIEFLGKDVSAGKTADVVEGKYNKLGGRMNQVGKIAGRALAGGLLLAGAAAVKMGKAAAEDEAGASKLAQTLHTAAHATKAQVAETESWITAQGKAFGVADDDLRPALAKLATATGSVTKAQQAARLAMDVSTGSGKDLGAVSAALAKAYSTGTVTALGKYGVATKDADGKTRSLADITKDLATKYQGASAKAAETTAGKQKILAVQFQELQETIGAKLLPVMQKLTDWALKAIDWMGKHATLIKTLAAVILPLVAGLAAIVKVTKAYTEVQKALNLVFKDNPIGAVITVLALLAAGLVYAYKNSETFRNVVNGAFRGVMAVGQLLWNTLKGVFRLIIMTWLDVAGGIINAAARAFGWVPGLGDKLKHAAAWFNTFRDQVNEKLGGIHKDIKLTADTSQARKNISGFVTFANTQLSKLPKGVHAGATGGSGAILTQGLKKKALGGPVTPGQPYIVGENRPELFVPNQSGRIVPRVPAGASTAPREYVVDLRLDGKTIQKILLKEKRTNGGMALGLA